MAANAITLGFKALDSMLLMLLLFAAANMFFGPYALFPTFLFMAGVVLFLLVLFFAPVGLGFFAYFSVSKIFFPD